jgi:hypothetical protein
MLLVEQEALEGAVLAALSMELRVLQILVVAAVVDMEAQALLLLEAVA